MSEKHKYKYKSIIKKNKKKDDKIVSLSKTKLITMKVLISKALHNSYINHDEKLQTKILVSDKLEKIGSCL